MSNDSHSVLLGREYVTRAPEEVTAKVLESLNQHFRMNAHVEISIDMGAARHLKDLSSDLLWCYCNIFYSQEHTVDVITHDEYYSMFSGKGESIEDNCD